METNQTNSNVTALRDEGGSPSGYRPPPHNYEAEQALLGAILENNLAYEKVSEFLRPEHFADPVHGRIFEAAGRLIRKGQIADVVTLKNFFESDGTLSDIGGTRFLAQLAGSLVTVINAVDYARVIHDLFLRRHLISLGEDIVNAAYIHDLEASATDQIEAAERNLYELATTGQTEGGFQTFEASLASAVKMAEVAYKREGRLTGVATGLKDLDKLLGGLHASDLVILAGRPSMGKAQPLTARVLTVHGWKTMGELQPGDELVSLDGARSVISGIYPQGLKQIYRVSFSDGRSTEACAEHLWRVHYRAWGEPRILSTAEIARLLARKRYQGRLWIDHCSGHFGHHDALPVDPWMLGVLLGDGTLKGSAVRVSSASDEILRGLAERLGEEFELRTAGGYDYRVAQTRGARRPGRQGVWPNALKEALRELDLWDRGAQEKFVPEIYKTTHKEARLALLRGLLDTDGWVESWGSIRFATTSERLAGDVVDLARSVGAWATRKARQTAFTYGTERRPGRTSWVINIHHPEPQMLFTHASKRARVSAGPKRRKMPVIVSIEPSRIAEARCISVTHRDGLYITDEFIVTHNTALATNIAFNAARAYREEKDELGNVAAADGAVVGFFSLEMSVEQLATRILAEQAKVSSEKIRRGELGNEDFQKVVRASQELSSLPLYIDDAPALTMSAIRTRARRLKRQRGLGLVVVDYLQLITPTSSTRYDSRVQEISEITRGLKALAKELQLPVLALSQLSRAVEQREDKRPQLADLRESGSIEQDADVVMFIFREEYYAARREPTEGTDKHLEWQQEMDRVHNLAEVLVAKQRHGPIGKVVLHFEGPTTKFADHEQLDHIPDAFA